MSIQFSRLLMYDSTQSFLAKKFLHIPTWNDWSRTCPTPYLLLVRRLLLRRSCSSMWRRWIAHGPGSFLPFLPSKLAFSVFGSCKSLLPTEEIVRLALRASMFVWIFGQGGGQCWGACGNTWLLLEIGRRRSGSEPWLWRMKTDEMFDTGNAFDNAGYCLQSLLWQVLPVAGAVRSFQHGRVRRSCCRMNSARRSCKGRVWYSDDVCESSTWSSWKFCKGNCPPQRWLALEKEFAVDVDQPPFLFDFPSECVAGKVSRSSHSVFSLCIWAVGLCCSKFVIGEVDRLAAMQHHVMLCIVFEAVDKD